MAAAFCFVSVVCSVVCLFENLLVWLFVCLFIYFGGKRTLGLSNGVD